MTHALIPSYSHLMQLYPPLSPLASYSIKTITLLNVTVSVAVLFLSCFYLHTNPAFYWGNISTGTTPGQLHPRSWYHNLTLGLCIYRPSNELSPTPQPGNETSGCGAWHHQELLHRNFNLSCLNVQAGNISLCRWCNGCLWGKQASTRPLPHCYIVFALRRLAGLTRILLCCQWTFVEVKHILFCSCAEVTLGFIQLNMVLCYPQAHLFNPSIWALAGILHNNQQFCFWFALQQKHQSFSTFTLLCEKDVVLKCWPFTCVWRPKRPAGLNPLFALLGCWHQLWNIWVLLRKAGDRYDTNMTKVFIARAPPMG